VALEPRARYHRFMSAWAETHGMSYREAQRNPLARAYYAMSHDAPRRMIAQAWTAAGVLEAYRDERGRERWRYVA
jgi:glycogen debranching enzyme